MSHVCSLLIGWAVAIHWLREAKIITVDNQTLRSWMSCIVITRETVISQQFNWKKVSSALKNQLWPAITAVWIYSLWIIQDISAFSWILPLYGYIIHISLIWELDKTRKYIIYPKKLGLFQLIATQHHVFSLFHGRRQMIYLWKF